ncbi:MAG: hypothetical protein ACHQNA_03095 [Acidimicrobiales bacterium]
MSVTPWAVAPLAVPGPHTAFNVPKSPGPGPGADVDVAAAEEELEFAVLLRLQPPATSATHSPVVTVAERQ